MVRAGRAKLLVRTIKVLAVSGSLKRMRRNGASPVVKAQSPSSLFKIVDGEMHFNLPEGPVLVVATSAKSPELVHGAQLLENVRSEQDLVDAALDLQQRFPIPA